MADSENSTGSETRAETLLNEMHELLGAAMDAIEDLTPENFDSQRVVATTLVEAANERGIELTPFLRAAGEART